MFEGKIGVCDINLREESLLKIASENINSFTKPLTCFSYMLN